jgi:hypothetical protein
MDFLDLLLSKEAYSNLFKNMDGIKVFIVLDVVLQRITGHGKYKNDLKNIYVNLVKEL